LSKLDTEKTDVGYHIPTAATYLGKDKTSMLPFISVVIPIHNEEEFISDTLEHIAAQDYPGERYEVLLIDGMSSDWSREIAHSRADLFENFRLLDNPKKISSAARNIGFDNARGEYIIVVDGHVYIENKRLFRDMVEIFTETGLDVLSRPQPLTPPDNSYFQNAVAYSRESFIGHGMGSTIYDTDYTGPVDPSSSGAMYRRDAIKSVGQFDESFDAAEDYEFNYRVALHNKHSYISPRLAIYYYPRNRLSCLFTQMRRYGLGRNKMLRKHGDGFRSGTVIPPLFFFSLLIFALLSIFVDQLWLLTTLMGSVYLSALIISSCSVACRKGIRYLPVLPFIYLTIHLGLAYGMISGFFNGGARENTN
jgi:succinoglycan biosynthesis protein ExoA